MGESDNILLRLPARGVRTMVEEFHRVRRRAAEGEDVRVPLATFHLRTGRDLAGWVVSLAEEGHGRGEALVLEVADVAGRPSGDLAYLDPNSIEALTVHNISAAIAVLSFGAIEAPPGTPAPSRIAVKRRLEELVKAFADSSGVALVFEVAWERIAPEGEPLRSLSFLIEDTVGALRDIVDDYGREELSRQVKRVRFEYADSATVQLLDAVLLVKAELEKGRQGRLDRHELKKAIAAVL